MQTKQLRKSATAIALLMALGAGFAATPALADLPSKQDVKEVDANKDGKVSKQEFLAFMGKRFEQTAGAKGYCTYEEIRYSMPTEWNY
jgi:hypothetical protein